MIKTLQIMFPTQKEIKLEANNIFLEWSIKNVRVAVVTHSIPNLNFFSLLNINHYI